MFLKLMTSAALAAITLGSATTSTSTGRPARKHLNIKGMKNVTFLHGNEEFNRTGLRKIASNSDCSHSERKTIMDSVRKADAVIKRAYTRWPKASFKKWFGKGTPEDNDNVKRRYKYAMDYL